MRDSRAICLACRVRLSSQAFHSAVAAAAATSLRGPWHTAVGHGRAASFSAAPRKRRPRQPDDGALAIFQDVVEKQQEEGQQQQQQQQQQPPSGRSLAAGTELYQQLVKLTQLRSEPSVSIAELYAFFDSQMYPLMAQTPRDLPNIFKQAARQLVRDVSAARQRDYRAADLPSVARITQVRRQLDLLNVPEPWVPLVLGLVEEILSTRQDDALAGTRAAQLDDLVQAWRIFSLPDIVVADEEALGQEAAGSFRLPTPDAMLLARYAHQRNLRLGLAGLFPRYVPRNLRPVVPAVLATYALLTDPDVVGGVAEAETKARADEFLEAVGAVLAVVQIDRAAVADMFVSRPDLGAYVLGRWPLVGVSSESGSSSSSNSSNKQQQQQQQQRQPSPVTRPRGRSSSLDAVHRQLSQALGARNPGACEAAWDVFWSSVTVPDADGADRLRESAEMFDYFIMAFTTMRQPERAIGIWNLMTLAGVTPTLRTWTSFLEGCKRASNPTGIRNIWDKLAASGMAMDTAVWTARISGLIQAGEAEAGIRALEEMQEVWEAEVNAANTNTNTSAVKPTIEPVNAAISGLLRCGDLGAARQILGWAGRHGIPPDLITFNTILRPLVREGRGDEVAGLLEMMAQLGLQPDEATVTVLLEGALGGGGGSKSSPRDLQDTVRWMLAAVEAAGLVANQQTYAKMVHLLLQEGGNGSSQQEQEQADAAVEVVLAHMAARGLSLSSQICTILADHYFSRQPPDLEAVRTLIETGGVVRRAGSGSSSGGESEGERGDEAEEAGKRPDMSLPIHRGRLRRPQFDRVFWERVVGGFAQVDDTASAQRYFEHIADSQSVTTSTLEDLLRALVRSADWEAAARLVAKVQAQKMLLVQGGETARAYDARLFRHRFWHLAAKHGLLQQ